MFLLILKVLSVLVLSVLTQTYAQSPKRCDYEKSNYFVILNKMTFDEAAMACVDAGAVLAEYTNAVGDLVETCAEWEMDRVEPWIARRLGDIECPFVRMWIIEGDDNLDRVNLAKCTEKRACVCWRYPIAQVTDVVLETATDHVTVYEPVIISTLFTGSPPTKTTFTWTETIIDTVTEQSRVPLYVLEWDAEAGTKTLTTTLFTSTVIVEKDEPVATVTFNELGVAVLHETVRETVYTSTHTDTVYAPC